MVVIVDRTARAGVLALEVAIDARSGQGVAFIAPSLADARVAFKAAAAAFDDLYIEGKVCRVNGQERIELDGGANLHFLSVAGRGYRGLSVETIVIEEALMRNVDVRLEIAPMLATSKGGGFINY